MDERGPAGFDERFYRRQRAEILERVAREAGASAPRAPGPRRGVRRAALPLAAALLLVALLAGGLALRGPGAGSAPAAAASDADWLFDWDLPAELDGTDPLDGYGPASADTLAADDAADDLDDVLPPLTLEEEDNG